MLPKIFNTLLVGIVVGAFATIWFAPSFISPQEREHSVFVYGTLQNNLLRYYACRCLITESPATLTGYKKVGLNIIPTPNESVSGSVLQVSTTQLERIDRYENVPQNYTRNSVDIDGETHWVYIKNE